jgi:aryl-alcohol dehydrogenase-like predicted oxidoreductase
LGTLVRSGRLRALGLSNATFAQLRSALSLQASLGLSPFRVLQNNNNVALRDVDSDLRTLCAESGVAIVTYSPLGAGFLTGKHSAGVVPGSRFDVAPGHRDLYFTAESNRRLVRLESLSVQTGHSMAQLALAWALHQPGVASVLVGGRSPAHLDQAFTALALDDPRLLSELDAL